MADLASELSDLMRDLDDRKGHSAWLIANWPTVLHALRSSAPSSGERTSPLNACQFKGFCEAESKRLQELEPSAAPAEGVIAPAYVMSDAQLRAAIRLAVEEDRRTRSATALTRAELDALIDFHDYNDAGAEAMDCVEQSKYHAERSKHYAALRDALPPADSQANDR